ncbi:MAG: SDR family oxidoreductase [Chromatiales bacterium]|nr:SDR family oxidoreductase [Chromatiales bacterium]
MFDFNDKVALVTGAAGNLGQAVAKGFFTASARLALVDRDTERLANAFPDWAEDERVLMLDADLTNDQSVQSMAMEAAEHFGRVDILANIAGGFRMGPKVHETSEKDWDFMLDLNTRSVFLTCKAIIPGMLQQGGGRIVNVSARAAREGKARMAPYCVSKAGVITLTEALAAEHKHDNIRVNCILPGTIDTPQNRTDMPDADHSSWVPTGDLANVILFLVSDAARSVSGAAVPVFGRS